MEEVTLLEFITVVAHVVTALAAVAAVCGVGWQIKAQRKLVRENNSINVIQSVLVESNLTHAMNLVSRISSDKNDSVEFYASPDHLKEGTGKSEWDEESREKHHALTTMVNYFETISMGIQQKVYDEKIIRSSYATIFIVMYERTWPFIREVREKHNTPTFGEHFELFAKKFKKDS